MTVANVGQTVVAKVHNGEVTGTIEKKGRHGVTLQTESKRLDVNGKSMSINHDETVVVQRRAIIEVVK